MIKKLCAVVFLVTAVLCIPSFALSDAEYRTMMKNPDFARADRRLNDTWKKVSRTLSGSALQRLKENQREWISVGRDASAKDFLDDYSRVEAYTIATDLRADELPKLAQSLSASASSSGVQGSYVRKEHGEETAWLNVRMLNRKTSQVEVEISAVYLNSSGFANTGEWNGKGRIKNGVLNISDGDGNITIIFESSGRVRVETSDFSEYTGMGVEFDGTYFRNK